jgi:DNA repair protein RadC
MLQALQDEVLDQPVLGSSEALRRYLFACQAHASVEIVRVLLLDSRNRLIRDAVVSEGGPNATSIQPREIIRLCLEAGASAMILAHNHPSGDPTPSASDTAVTRRLAGLAHELGIALHDHVIVARAGVVSLRSLGLI